MTDVDLRVVHEYRVYKREDNGDNQTCNAITMQGQVSTLRRFLEEIADINAVPEELSERIRLPRIEGDPSSDTQLDSGRRTRFLTICATFSMHLPNTLRFYSCGERPPGAAVFARLI